MYEKLYGCNTHQHLGQCLDKVVFMTVGHDITLEGTLGSLEVISTDVTSFLQCKFELAPTTLMKFTSTFYILVYFL